MNKIKTKTMKNILIILTLFLFSCNDNVTISKEEYNKLKGNTAKPEYPKPFKFKEPSFSANWIKFAIIEGEDSHEYLVNSGGNSFAFIHYPDCKKCKRDTL